MIPDGIPVAGAGPIAVSAALDPALLRQITAVRPDAHLLPVYRGRAVLPEAERFAAVVVGVPNHLGRVEPDFGPGTIRVWDERFADRPEGDAVRLGHEPDPRLAERTAGARHLVKRLCQWRGVLAPWEPETPIGVVTLPFPPPVGMPVVVPPFPGLPGAIRVVVEPGATTASIGAYAAEIERHMKRGERA